MNSSYLSISIALLLCVWCINGEDGKYSPRKYNQNAGRYTPTRDAAYHHVEDMRELGRYIHIPFPYMGGYGPYSHIPNPYLHDPDARFPYEHVSSPSEYHPFNQDCCYVQKPDIELTYGFPNIPSKHSYPTNPIDINSIDYHTTTTTTTTTTDPNNVENDSTTILTGDSLTKRKKRSLSYSQPQLVRSQDASTTRPRTRYDDEGKWRIIRQEENKQEKKYDYFFETENKIFAQEAGKIAGKDVAHEGTSGVGWYQYIGDDGKVYRVDYEAGAQGFVPKGAHIHKAIQKHLDSLKERNLV